MGFLTSLFGGEGASLWGAAFALVFVLVLIVAGLWLLKLVFKASGSVARGRNRRLAIIDTLSLDGKRNLVLVRRDDVEHLIVVGGANDVLVEAGIEAPSATQRPGRKAQPGETAHSPAANHNQHARTAHEQTAAASRLGVTGLLRRYGNETPHKSDAQHKSDTPHNAGMPGTEAVQEPAAPEPRVEAPRPGEPRGPVDRPRAMQQHGSGDEGQHGRTLRHTGLLRPNAGDEQEFPVHFENPAPRSPDSARNARDEADPKAMASIEEGAASEHDGAGESAEFDQDGNRERQT